MLVRLQRIAPPWYITKPSYAKGYVASLKAIYSN